MSGISINRSVSTLIYVAALIGITFAILKIINVFGGSISMSPGRLIPKLYLNLIFYLTETIGVVAAAYFLLKGKIKSIFIIHIICAVALVIQVLHLNSIFNSQFRIISLLVLPYYAIIILYLYRKLEAHNKSLQPNADAPVE